MTIESEDTLVLRKRPGLYRVLIREFKQPELEGYAPWPETRYVSFKHRDTALAYVTAQLVLHPTWELNETGVEDQPNTYGRQPDPHDRILTTFHLSEPGTATPM